MARVTQQAEKVQAAETGDVADDVERARRVRIDAAAMSTDVDLHEHVESLPGRDHPLRPLPGDLQIVHDDGETDAVQQREHARGVRRD